MASPPSFGLGGSTNHSIRDVGKAEPRAEVDRPIASQGINVDMRSLFELPVTQNPHKFYACKETPGFYVDICRHVKSSKMSLSFRVMIIVMTSSMLQALVV